MDMRILSDVLRYMLRAVPPGLALLVLLGASRETMYSRRNGLCRARWGLQTLLLLLLTAMQAAIWFSFRVYLEDKQQGLRNAFLSLMGLQWVLFLTYRLGKRSPLDLEVLAFLLCSGGIAVVGSAAPAEVGKQLFTVALGVLLFLLVRSSLVCNGRLPWMPVIVGVTGIALLLLVLLFGKTQYGAKNWLEIGRISIQPSEFVKLCFVYVLSIGLCPSKRRLEQWLLFFYTGTLCVLLICMNDFGTALVFYVVYFLACGLRGDGIAAPILALVMGMFAGRIGLETAPHVLRRLLAWRNIWQDPLGAGFQQTRSLMCIASGGLFGLGASQGIMGDMFAGDSDLVFATLCEEWGLLLGVLLVISMLVICCSALINAGTGEESWHRVGAGCAAGFLLVQTILNVFGTVDLLPLTGINFPFLSNGGSSMLSVWGLLGFLKGPWIKERKESREDG